MHGTAGQNSVAPTLTFVKYLITERAVGTCVTLTRHRQSRLILKKQIVVVGMPPLLKKRDVVAITSFDSHVGNITLLKQIPIKHI
eukprot:4916179-Amphidinium_carterae.1